MVEKLGFDACGFCSPFLNPDELAPLKNMVENKRYGTMDFLERHLELRQNPELLLEGVKTAIVVVKNYRNTNAGRLSGKLKIARFAVGRDYHFVVGQKLKAFCDFMRGVCPGEGLFWGVDSKPLSERAYAVKAGLGFMGKNGLVITPDFGSYVFIGVVLSTLKFEFDNPLSENCLDCGLCLKACPTGALSPDGFDASKCTSYRTQKTVMDPVQAKQSNGWLFGCDMCQEVCPHNAQGALCDWPELLPQAGCGFDFFKSVKCERPPKVSPLFRCRKNICANWDVYSAVF